MNELIEKLISEAGVSPEQAAKAITVISDYIKSKTPPMMHPMIDNFLSAPPSGNDTPDFMD